MAGNTNYRPSLAEDMEQRYNDQSAGGAFNSKNLPVANDSTPTLEKLYNTSQTGGAFNTKQLPVADDTVPMLEAMYKKSQPLSIHGLDTTPYH